MLGKRYGQASVEEEGLGDDLLRRRENIWRRHAEAVDVEVDEDVSHQLWLTAEEAMARYSVADLRVL